MDAEITRPLVAPCRPGDFHVADTREIRVVPGGVGRHRRQPTLDSRVAAGVAFLDKHVPGWREPKPWDQVPFADSRCVAGHVAEAWKPPRLSWWRRLLSALGRRLSRHRASVTVSAFNEWFEEDPWA